MPEPKASLAEHEKIMADAKAKIIADIERSTGITLAETTAEQLRAAKVKRESLEQQAVYSKIKTGIETADVIRARAARFSDRVDQWIALGRPSTQVLEVLGVVGL